MNEAIADGNARVINAPRVTVLDGLTAKLIAAEIRFIDFDGPQKTATANKETNDNDEDAAAPNPPLKKIDEWKEGVTSVESQTGFRAAPVLHGDVMNLGFQIILNNIITPGSTIMRDGQTFAVRLPNVNVTNGWPYMALIKAHIIHRAGDEKNKGFRR